MIKKKIVVIRMGLNLMFCKEEVMWTKPAKEGRPGEDMRRSLVSTAKEKGLRRANTSNSLRGNF